MCPTMAGWISPRVRHIRESPRFFNDPVQGSTLDLGRFDDHVGHRVITRR